MCKYFFVKQLRKNQLYFAWELKRKKKQDMDTRKMQVEQQKRTMELHQILIQQEQVLDPLLQQLPTYQSYYQQFSKSLHDTMHRTKVDGVYFDPSSTYNGILQYHWSLYRY